MDYFKNGSKTFGVNIKILTKKSKHLVKFLDNNSKILGVQHFKILTSTTDLQQVLLHLLFYFTGEQKVSLTYNHLSKARALVTATQ